MNTDTTITHIYLHILARKLHAHLQKTYTRIFLHLHTFPYTYTHLYTLAQFQRKLKAITQTYKHNYEH